MEEILDAIRRRRLYGLAAEIRAVEEGHNARVLPDGSVLVKAESRPGSYRVVLRAIADGVLWFGCSCRSGEYRASLPVPCTHAAVAARRLEREGLARWEDGSWRLRERAQVRGARLLLARTVDAPGRSPRPWPTRPETATSPTHATATAAYLAWEPAADVQAQGLSTTLVQLSSLSRNIL